MRCGERVGAPTHEGTWKLDYIFFSSEYQNLQGDVVESMASDHSELWATAAY